MTDPITLSRNAAVPSHVDILIVGGGPVGGPLALMLAASGRNVAVLEARDQPGGDTRALAIAAASKQVLADLACWDAAAATPIRQVHVSQQGAFGRVRLDCAELGLPALGYVMPYRALATKVDSALHDAHTVSYLTGSKVVEIKSLDAYAAIEMERAGHRYAMTAQLVVLAEGGKLLRDAGITQHERDYEQVAVVAEVQTTLGQQGVAFERFASDGPIALLPKDDGYALVWTRPANDPSQIISLTDGDFLAALQARIGDRAGMFTSVGPRAAFPLRLKWASTHHTRRVAVVGNAAQTLHPVAGQGFNLGLRDALALARLIRTTSAETLGDKAMLDRYAALRRTDSLATVGLTDSLIKLFGVDSTPLRHLRAAGFLAMDNVKPLRKGFAQRMVFGTQ